MENMSVTEKIFVNIHPTKLKICISMVFHERNLMVVFIFDILQVFTLIGVHPRGQTGVKIVKKNAHLPRNNLWKLKICRYFIGAFLEHSNGLTGVKMVEHCQSAVTFISLVSLILTILIYLLSFTWCVGNSFIFLYRTIWLTVGCGWGAIKSY